MEGTNNEEEAFFSFSRSGAAPDYVHINDLSRKIKKLEDYDSLFIPGGFSAGDYVRGGAIFALRFSEAVSTDIDKFIDEGKPVVGVCNGFQILAEMGLIPAFSGERERLLTLASNASGRFECRYTYMKMVSTNPIFVDAFGDRRSLQVPVAHLEGRVTLKDKSRTLRKLIENDQILFKYTNKDGTSSEYPWNPNGSLEDIAAITNESGNVVGMMPHPERVYYGYQLEGREKFKETGTGEIFFNAIVKYTHKIRA